MKVLEEDIECERAMRRDAATHQTHDVAIHGLTIEMLITLLFRVRSSVSLATGLTTHASAVEASLSAWVLYSVHAGCKPAAWRIDTARIKAYSSSTRGPYNMTYDARCTGLREDYDWQTTMCKMSIRQVYQMVFGLCTLLLLRTRDAVTRDRNEPYDLAAISKLALAGQS